MICHCPAVETGFYPFYIMLYCLTQIAHIVMEWSLSFWPKYLFWPNLGLYLGMNKIGIEQCSCSLQEDHSSLTDSFDKWPKILKRLRTTLYLNVWAIVIIFIVKVVKLGRCSEHFGGQQKHWIEVFKIVSFILL